jgi:hypothetical protein
MICHGVLFPADSAEEQSSTDYIAMRRMFSELTWHNYVVAFFLLAIVMIGQVLFTDLPFSPYQVERAAGQILIDDMGTMLGRTSYISTTLGPSLAFQLEIDGEIVWKDMIQTSSILEKETFPYFEEFDLTPGSQKIRLSLIDNTTETSFVYFDAPVMVSDGDILTIPFPSN